jgi:hypothetical protein
MVGKKGPRKLLVASVGVATINYLLVGCDTFGPPGDEQPSSPDFFMGTGGKVSGPTVTKGGGPSIPPTSGNLPTPMPMGGFAGFGGFAGQNFGGAAGGGMGGGGAGGTGGMSTGDGGDASGGDGAGGAERAGAGGDDASGGDGAGGVGGAP